MRIDAGRGFLNLDLLGIFLLVIQRNGELAARFVEMLCVAGEDVEALALDAQVIAARRGRFEGKIAGEIAGRGRFGRRPCSLERNTMRAPETAAPVSSTTRPDITIWAWTAKQEKANIAIANGLDKYFT